MCFIIFELLDPDTTSIVSELPDDYQSFGLAGWGVTAFSENGTYQNTLTITNFSITDIIPVVSDVNLVITNIVNDLTSVGNVTLLNNDPASKPKIFHNYLDTSQDRIKVVEALKLGRRLIYNSDAFDGLIFNQTFEIFPGFDIQTDEDILNIIKYSVTTAYHATSTCAINKVVDTNLKVFGFNNLRIADASVMPTPVSANTNQMTMVIGRKAANYIIAEC